MNVNFVLLYNEFQCLLQAGLREKLTFLRKKELGWLERMDVTSQPGTSMVQSEGETSNEKEDANEVDPEDDFKREMHL